MNSDIIFTFSESTSLPLQLRYKNIKYHSKKETGKSHLTSFTYRCEFRPFSEMTYRTRIKEDEKRQKGLKLMFVHCFKKEKKNDP